MTEREKIAERIEKLLVLADPTRNDSEGQIMAALQKARELMDKYQISESELSSDEKQREPDLVDECLDDIGNGRKTIQLWVLVLCAGLKTYCDVITVTTNNKHSYRVLGRPDDVILFKQMFSFVREQMIKLKNIALLKSYLEVVPNRMSDDMFSRTYLEGMATALKERLKSAAMDRKNYSMQMQGLILAKEARAKNFFSEQYPNCGRFSIRTQEAGAHGYGRMDADRVRFHPVVGGNSSAVVRR